MPDDIGRIRLYDPKSKIEYYAVVLIFQEGNKYSFCPIWKETVNKLVPIMKDKDCEYYIDASDPFAYELFSHKTLADRIEEFNKLYIDKEIPDIKIVKIASTADLERASLPVYKEEGSKRVIIAAE